MAREDAFNAAKATSTLLGGFFKDVANEIGLEKALSLYAKHGEVLGAMMARAVKERLGDKEFDMKTLASVASGFSQICGFTYELEETPTSIKVKSSSALSTKDSKTQGWTIRPSRLHATSRWR